MTKMADSQQNLSEEVKPVGMNPPITMKVDAPAEDNCTQENEDNERKAEEEFKVCSPSTNSHPSNSASSNPFAAAQYKFSSRGILKPPQLSLNNTTNNQPKSPFTLNPSRLNPFVSSSTSEEPSSSDKKSSQVNGETPKFVPLIQGDSKSNSSNHAPIVSSTTNNSGALSSGTSFVFGQNLQERVIAAADAKNDLEPTPSTSLTSNGTTEMLFSSAIKTEVKPDSSGSTSSSSKETKSLSESAREYEEESRANKRKYEEVEVKTGEEGETNILNFTCKLFAFDKNGGTWQERGRGVIRLNDIESGDHHTSRLVFRTTGSLRVVLNTKIWAEMTVEQASDKSVRFTALDPNGEIKVYLAMATIDDSKQLCTQIKSRIEKEVSSQKHKKLHPTEPDSGGN